MIHDVQFLSARTNNTDESIYGSLRLTSEQGRLLGLRSEQIVRGVLDPGGNSILLTTDSASYRLSVTTAFNPNANLIFKAWVTPQGVILQPLRHSVTRQPKAMAGNTAPALTPPLTEMPPRLTLLSRLQIPLSALAALSSPRLITQLLARATSQANAERAIEQLWQGRDNIGASSIKAALVGSGLFNAGSAAAGMTLKKILDQLKKHNLDNRLNTDPIKLSDLDEAIDYLESAQLHGLLRQESGELLYRFPLLFYDAPPVEVRIAREQHRAQHEAEENWRIDLDIPLGDARNLEVSMQLLADATVNVVVWTKSKTLLALMQDETGALRNRLSDCDIALGSVQVVYGERPVYQDSPATSDLRLNRQLDCYT